MTYTGISYGHEQEAQAGENRSPQHLARDPQGDPRAARPHAGRGRRADRRLRQHVDRLGERAARPRPPRLPAAGDHLPRRVLTLPADFPPRPLLTRRLYLYKLLYKYKSPGLRELAARQRRALREG